MPVDPLAFLRPDPLARLLALAGDAAVAYAERACCDAAAVVDAFPLPEPGLFCVLLAGTVGGGVTGAVEAAAGGHPVEFGVVVHHDGRVIQDDVSAWGFYQGKAKFAGRAAWARRRSA